MDTSIVDITDAFAQVFFPRKALIFYQHALDSQSILVEKFDVGKNGVLCNAHPLSGKEMADLAEVFQLHKRKEQFLNCEGLLPENVLYLNSDHQCAVWYTPAEYRDVYFTQSLALQNGKLPVPALIWKATASQLSLFACKEKQRPSLSTKLYHAPFFNVYDDGNICMGTVQVAMESCPNILEFMNRWELYFFNSRFSHVIGQQKHTKTVITKLYQQLINQQSAFPQKELVGIKKTLEHILP